MFAYLKSLSKGRYCIVVVDAAGCVRVAFEGCNKRVLKRIMRTQVTAKVCHLSRTGIVAGFVT